jgi:hypothetical protein
LGRVAEEDEGCYAGACEEDCVADALSADSEACADGVVEEVDAAVVAVDRACEAEEETDRLDG